MTEFPLKKSKWLTANGFSWIIEIDAIFNQIDDQAEENKSYFNINYGVSSSTSPVNIFKNTQLDSHTASDLLRGLLTYWENESLPDSEQQFYLMRQGLLTQVTTLCRHTYVEFLSSIEFGIIQSIEKVPEIFEPPKRKQKVYLGKVIERSAALGWISIEHQKAWEGLIELRNALAHRSGISDKTHSYKITETHALDFEKGKAFGGHINGMAKLCEWARSATFIWSKSYFKVLMEKRAK